MIGIFHGQNPQLKEWDPKMNIGKSKKPMPCPCTGPKSFWAGPFFFCARGENSNILLYKKNQEVF